MVNVTRGGEYEMLFVQKATSAFRELERKLSLHFAMIDFHDG